MLNFSSFSYFSYSDDSDPFHMCNRQSDSLPFVVNCAGLTCADEAYCTKATRSDWLLLYVKSGTLTVWNKQTGILCKPGSFILFPPEKTYCYSHEAGELIECYWTHFSGSAIESTISYYDFKVSPKINYSKYDSTIDFRYDTIFNTFIQNDTFRDKELSILLDRLFLSFAKRSPFILTTQNSLSKSLNFINENYTKKLYIPDLAKVENLSTSRYNVLFRQTTGLTPTDYIKRLRLNHACELLLSTDLPVNVIGEIAGYEDQYFFSKIFKKAIGVTPREYRKNKNSKQ